MPTTSTRRKNNVRVQYAVPRRGLPGPASLRKWAALVPVDAILRIVGADEARRLNRVYRRRAYATNVLSFPYGKNRGDVVLCHPVIVREAREQGKKLAAHYAHLVLHGLLHLRGYEHERKREAEMMERAEIRLLRRAGFGNPYTVE
ncbi:MAG: putative rRNA maturation factor [Betaproteobacteria bacterium]|nr:putative rRNA maturation factor [Betaproteobacteria bacterium]